MKELRLQRELTQEQLAKELGIARPTLCHYEKGRLQIPNELIPKIAKFFDVTTDYLFDLER